MTIEWRLRPESKPTEFRTVFALDSDKDWTDYERMDGLLGELLLLEYQHRPDRHFEFRAK